MLLKAKRLDNLQQKVSDYKNKVVIKYLNSKGYECGESRESIVKVNRILKEKYQKVLIKTENERISKLGSYYTWEADIKVNLIDTITGKEV